jgi:anionic cell wall polymer biosynthesis LytR-Cps2A-Psr (LCP) family protein
LARARGTGFRSYGFGKSDFARTEHQRQILVGLKDKAISAGTLSNPLKLGQLFDSMGNNVETDFEVSEIRRLFDLVKEIPSAKIRSVSLDDAEGKSLLESYRTRSGQSALIPVAGIDDYTEIQAYLNSL